MRYYGTFSGNWSLSYHEMKRYSWHDTQQKIDNYGGDLDFPGEIGTELPDENVIVVLPDLLEVHLAGLHHLHDCVTLYAQGVL